MQQNYNGLLQDSRQHIEISIDAIGILDNLVNRLTTCGGISSIIDYGHNGNKEDTFRGFYQHKLHDPLTDPGKADLTVDVDFSIIRKLLDKRAMIFGPVSQRDFLSQIGIEHRLKVIII